MNRTIRFFTTMAVVWMGLVGGSVIAESPPLKVVLISGSELYKSEISLSEFKDYLENNHPVQVTLLQATGKANLPGLEALEDCDIALIYTRRLEIEGEQLERIKKYCLSGKPLAAVRTTSHGFQNWLELDQLVLGGSYHGHYKADVLTRSITAPGMENHPVLSGVGVLDSTASLYRTHPIAKDATMLLGGVAPEGAQPLAWVREHEGGKVFYTSLGSVDDFRNPNFQRFIANALFWCARGEAAPAK